MARTAGHFQYGGCQVPTSQCTDPFVTSFIEDATSRSRTSERGPVAFTSHMLPAFSMIIPEPFSSLAIVTTWPDIHCERAGPPIPSTSRSLFRPKEDVGKDADSL